MLLWINELKISLICLFNSNLIISNPILYYTINLVEYKREIHIYINNLLIALAKKHLWMKKMRKYKKINCRLFLW